MTAQEIVNTLLEAEDVDDPSTEEVIRLGRPGDCHEFCMNCGAYCTLIHSVLPSGVQVPSYHICHTCDNNPQLWSAPVADVLHQVALRVGGPVNENDADDPATFMQNLDQKPDHELVNTSSPPPGSSRSFSCVCGQWFFSGVASDEAERTVFDQRAREEFTKHAQSTRFAPDDPYDKLRSRNFITGLRLKEADEPEPLRPKRKTKAERLAAEMAADPKIQQIDDPEAFIQREIDRRSEPIHKIEVGGRRWYRRGTGGVYCKAYIYINDKLVHVTPEQYGYGDHYLTLAAEWLRRNTTVGDMISEREPFWHLRDKHGIDIQYAVRDVMRERDL